MSETKFKLHPKNPSNQPFNVTAKPNKTKSKAWYQVGSSRIK